MGFDPAQDGGRHAAALVDQEAHRVSTRVFHDPQVYETELDNLFAKAWMVVGHESEIPDAGDYVSRYIGEDPVIVLRASDGAINVMLNVCAHKAAQVCRADRGNATTFKCPYHGWLFGEDGRLLAMVAEREMYGDDFDKSSYGLTKARVDTYAGIVFATFDPKAPTLPEFLGDYKYYLDLLFDRSANGMEVAGPPQRWVIPANWKTAAEQFSSDGYHALTLHRSMVDIGLFGGAEPDFRTQGLFGLDISMPEGHAARCLDNGTAGIYDSSNADFVERRYRGLVPAGMTPEQVSELEERFDDEQLHVLGKYTPIVGQLFPNLGWLHFFFPTLDGQSSSVSTIRLWNPIGIDKMEVWNWVLVEKDAPEELKDRVRHSTVLTFSSSGIFEADDAEVWPSMHRVTRGAMGKRQSLNYVTFVGEKRPEDYPDEGVGWVFEGPSKEDNHWQWWIRWAEFMADKAW